MNKRAEIRHVRSNRNVPDFGTWEVIRVTAKIVGKFIGKNCKNKVGVTFRTFPIKATATRSVLKFL